MAERIRGVKRPRTRKPRVSFIGCDVRIYPQNSNSRIHKVRIEARASSIEAGKNRTSVNQLQLTILKSVSPTGFRTTLAKEGTGLEKTEAKIQEQWVGNQDYNSGNGEEEKSWGEQFDQTKIFLQTEEDYGYPTHKNGSPSQSMGIAFQFFHR